MSTSNVSDLARHSASETVHQLRTQTQLLPADTVRRSYGRPQIVVREHTNNAVRWEPGERLNHLIEAACIRFADRPAVVIADATLSYRDLNRRANQMARHLIEQGIRSGDRVGLILDKSFETYVAMLAVHKANAAYVPLDCAFPAERINFIIDDADISAVLTVSSLAERLAALSAKKIFVDTAAEAISAQPADPVTEVAAPIEPLAYIIYTSGTTGNPKGVGIGHASICNFVRVAAELYGYQPSDRIYQGMTIAFDFSVEEIWVPMMAGACLVPARSGATMLGEELAQFLQEHGVTVMACCPTLLATVEEELPELRLLLVGGEACPATLVKRWYRPGRRILNSYGPTEATVTATLTELTPDKPVTIGVPLSTYSVVILDPHEDKTIAPGELGEIGIAGVGLALGYMNRDELTMKKFIRDFLNIQNNPSGRIYRTGDLGRIDENGEIEYRGRIDTQVKIRGYRIELGEIEAVLLDLPAVAQAAVTVFEPEEGVLELVAYYALKQDADLPRSEISQALRAKLPAYMVPAFLEQLDSIPMTLSNKADLKSLPKPQLQRFSAAASAQVPPKTEKERIIHAALAEALRVERVSTEHHFFDELGANSLVMARVCAAVRKHAELANVSMRDIYKHPTIARLAHHLDQNEATVARVQEAFHTPSRRAYWTCGALQAAFYATYALFSLWIVDVGYRWSIAATGTAEIFARGVAAAVASFVAITACSIAVKWLLIGRFKAASIPIWSMGYLRFWVVKTLMRTSPAALFVGTPVYNAYLRLMGAKIGHNVIIASRHSPVCADMIAIGDDTILRKDSIVLGYRAQSNFIHVGPVTIGSAAFVGEGSVIDIDVAMGDDTQLAHASSLQSGQRVPDGSRYHGSPAVATQTDYCPVEGRQISALRRGVFATAQLGALFLAAGFLPFVESFWEHVDLAGAGFSIGSSMPGLLAASAILFFGSLLAGLASVYAVPRLCMIFLRPGVTYPTFGIHHLLQTVVHRVSNSRFLCVLFGDSSFITTYMRYVGWNLNTVQQTGSNMGTNQRHDNPFLCNIGSGTMVSDGLSMINVEMSATAFRLMEATIGENNYLGNDIHYPPNGKTGANVLLGTKTMIPIDGPVRENVGLLGSPAFEIPRMVDRDRDTNASIDEQTRRLRLRQKNVYNAATAGLFLLARWMAFFAALAFWGAATAGYERFGVLALFGGTVGVAALWLALFIALERASLRFKRLTPKLASIYDPYFWFHERHWKLSDSPITAWFPGTPFRNITMRCMGMRVGKMVFDCSQSITERTLTEVGDYSNLNEGAILQAHSLEEGVFKSDHIRIGNGCSIGPGAFVHYGVCMGDYVVLDADSFLMKGEAPASHSGWRGNPARMTRSYAAAGDEAGVDAAAKDDARYAVAA